MARKKSPDGEFDFAELANQVHNYDLNPVTREVYVHSHYTGGDDEGGIEYRMATQFVKNLHLLDRVAPDPILVHLQSPGGDWVHGMAMFDAIRAARSPVDILAYGEVSSMSSVLLQAGRRRVLTPSCEFMIHRAFLSLEGSSHTVHSNAAFSRVSDTTMLRIYASRAVGGAFFRDRQADEAAVTRFINNKIRRLGDWNLSASEAVEYGLADGILGKEFPTTEEIGK